MTRQNNFNQGIWRQWAPFLGCTLFGLAVAVFAASAAPSSQQNPCPGIYYEGPHNNTRIVPQGCPPNAATQRLIEQGRISGNQYNTSGSQTNVIQPPLPETRQNAIANVTPIAGKVNVRLQNNTNTQIFYQAIGYTDRRSLAGGNEVTLRNLPTPVTITLTRSDEGLLKVIPLSNSQTGSLAVSLDEATRLSSNQGTLRIQSDGQVFLN